MRRLTTAKVTFVALALGLGLAALLYKQAWRIPIMQNLRGVQLVIALCAATTPLAALLMAISRVAPWRSALLGAAISMAYALPVYLGSSALAAVRVSSRDKAALCNLRQLEAAADQYFLENGVAVVRYEDLVGPQQYVKSINAVAGEDYRHNFPYRHGDALSADFPDGRVVAYNEPPGGKGVYEPGERPPWRTGAAVPANPGNAATPANSGQPLETAPALSNEVLRQGQPLHRTRTGTMCASCHARKG